MRPSSTELLLGLGSGTGSIDGARNQPNITLGRFPRQLRRTLPPLLIFMLFFLLAPTASSGRPPWNADKPSCCKFNPESINASTSTGSLIVASVVVSSTADATELEKDLLCCPGAIFEVEWQGRVRIIHSLDVVGGTSLKITVRSVNALASSWLRQLWFRYGHLPSLLNICCHRSRLAAFQIA